MDRVAHFMYVQMAATAEKVKTMAFTRNRHVDPEIIVKTQCHMNYACLSDNPVCNAEPFLDWDVLLLRCRDKRSCAHKKNYRGLFICTCPVNRASFRIN